MVLTKKNPNFSFSDVDVLEFESRPYQNKKGEAVTYVSCLLRIDGKVFRFGCAKDVDLTDWVGKQTDLQFELSTWGDDLSPSIRVAGFARIY